MGKDSTKGKRYARGGRAGEVEKAFGFSLALLLARSAEIEALAAQRLNEHI
ncbi:helix-turn-helix domain-containing protein [Agrobacterium tumefaciens]|uniref:helix-turn-helix domain-containing protein n=1 Tax=Agrobacterium tumefaciens TaxID=358 RepID=UPI0022A90B90|nr:helix-turn-helix domain-containing protein [Agrobacterium tumefaciens]